MKQQNKFNSEEQQHEHAAEQQSTGNTTQEFPNVEALLRYDAARTATPAAIGERLRESSAHFPKPSRPWWRKLFSR